MKIVPSDMPSAQFHSYLLGAVAPRPIAFASTVDQEGRVNLSPFSFFNVFSSNPPILIFSPSRRVRDNTIKHTLENAMEHPEVVINIVNYALVEQMSLSSTEYPKGVNEFVKAGLKEVASELVKPPRVGEAPVSFECRVQQIIELGKEGGAGNLIVCEVLMMHIQESILNENRQIDPRKLDAVARMGGNWYCRANGDSLFEIAKPLTKQGIGIDQLPAHIRNSVVLTANHLGKLANVEKLPDPEEVAAINEHPDVSEIRLRFRNDSESMEYQLHVLARRMLDKGETEQAWLVLLQAAL